MKFLLSLLLIIALSFIAGLYLPWWSVAIVAFLVGLFIQQKAGYGFLAGFLAIFILWGVLAFIIDLKNESILSHKIAQILPLGGSSILLILVTAIVGALVGGFAAMAGTFLRPVSNRNVR